MDQKKYFHTHIFSKPHSETFSYKLVNVLQDYIVQPEADMSTQ